MSGQAGDIKQYVHAVVARLWLVAIIVLVAVAGVFWRSGRTPAVYTASATLFVTAPMLVNYPPLPGDELGFRPPMTMVTADIVQLISSRPIAERVARRLDAAPSEVQRAVSAGGVRGTSLIRVSATASTRDRAATLANVTAEEFASFFRETNRASLSETRRFVEDQLAQARARLEQSERAIQAFKESRQMPSVAAATAQIQAAMAASQSDLDAALLSVRETEARLAAARTRLRREQPVIVASRSTSDNPVFRRYQDRLVDLEIQRATLSQTYTPQHPRMEQIAREITDLRGRLTAEARTAIAEEITVNNPIHARLLDQIVNHEVDRTAIGARVEALQVTLRRRQAVAMSIPAAETEFNRLMRENRVLESNYMTLSNRHQEIVVRENMAGSFPASLQVVEPAMPPARPAPSSLPRTATAAALAGLVLGIAAALFLDSLDDRIRTPQDAERALGVPVLAQIPAQGGMRPAPATTFFAIGVFLAVLLAIAAAVRYQGDVPAGLRRTAAAVTSWATTSQPAGWAIGVAGEGR
jgi:uncharacterized protein involved in exopolysaccharide biosynthesis